MVLRTVNRGLLIKENSLTKAEMFQAYSLSDNSVGSTTSRRLRIGSCRLTGELVFGLLVAVGDHSVQ